MDYTVPKDEFWFALSICLWFLLAPDYFLTSFGEIHEGHDLYCYFNLQNPDGWQLNYPMLALWYLKGIALVAGNLQAFHIAFVSLAVIWFLAMFGVFSRMGMSLRDLALRSVVFAPVFLLVIARLDMVAIFLTVASVFLFTRGSVQTRWLSWILLSIAIYIKIFPAFLVPFFIVLELAEPAGRRSLARPAFFVILLCALLVLPENQYALSYQSARPPEIEGIYANALLIGNALFGLGAQAEYSYGSWNVDPPANLSFINPLSSAIQMLSAGAVFLLFLLDKKRKDRLWEYAFLVLGVAVLAGKVFSSTFILWPLAFSIPLMGSERIKRLLVLMFVVSLLSNLVYPTFFADLVLGSAFGLLVLTLRNILLFATLAYAAFAISGDALAGLPGIMPFSRASPRS